MHHIRSCCIHRALSRAQPSQHAPSSGRSQSCFCSEFVSLPNITDQISASDWYARLHYFKLFYFLKALVSRSSRRTEGYEDLKCLRSVLSVFGGSKGRRAAALHQCGECIYIFLLLLCLSVFLTKIL